MPQKKSKYIDGVLLKLRRQYSKDEYVAFLLKRNSDVELELGMVKSERDELEYKLNKVLKLDNDTRVRLSRSKFIQKLKSQLKELKNKNKDLKTENSKLLKRANESLYYKIKLEELTKENRG